MTISSSKVKNNPRKHKRTIVKQTRAINRLRKKKKIITKEQKEERKLRRLNKENRKIHKICKNMSETLGSLDSLAKLTGFTTRSGKILPLAFVITLAYGLFGNGRKSLNLLTSNMLTWFGIEISTEALSKRMRQKTTVMFLKKVFIKLLNFQLSNSCKGQYANLFKCFSAIKLEDSTSFELDESLKSDFKGTGGAGSKAGMKLNTCYDVTRNVITNVDISEGTKSDQKFANNIEKTMKKGELLIRDLGYFNLAAMKKMIDLGIFFISRLQKGIVIFLEGMKTPIEDLYDFLEKHTQNGDMIDQNMYIGKAKLPVRLIAIKVPEEVKQKRAKRYQKVRKKEPTEDYVTWSGYSVFITNIPRAMFSSEIIIFIYKIRWQIELFFRTIKETLCIQVIRTKTKNTTLCMIYAKLISLFTASVMVSYAESVCEEGRELSVDKTIKWLNNDNRMGEAIASIGLKLSSQKTDTKKSSNKQNALGHIRDKLKTLASFAINRLKILLELLIIEIRTVCKDKRKNEKSTYNELKEMIQHLEAA